jgi:hypothetical protein
MIKKLFIIQAGRKYFNQQLLFELSDTHTDLSRYLDLTKKIELKR